MLSRFITELFSWAESVLRGFPGGVGRRLRSAWYQRRFHTCGRVHIDPGCEFLTPGSMRLGENVGIGRNGFFTAEGGEIQIGARTAFNVNAHINASVGGAIVIGEECLFGPNVVLRTAGHRFDRLDVPIRQQGHVVGDIRIGNGVWLGSNVVVVGGTTIGDGAVVGAGAVVTRSIPAGAVAVGVPARVIRVRGGRPIGP